MGLRLDDPEDNLFALRDKVRVAGSNEAQLRAWNVHASAIASVPNSEIETFGEAVNLLLETIIPIKFGPSVEVVNRDLASLRQFAATADPVALQGFDISWSSHAGFPCSRGVTKLLGCGPMSQLLTGLLCGDQAALDTCMVFLGFRRSKLQRLAEPLIVQDEYEAVKINQTKPLAIHAVNKQGLKTWITCVFVG